MNINLACPINTLGYGYASFHFLKNLVEQNTQVSLWPIGPVEADPQYHEMIRGCIGRQINGDYDPETTSLRIFHANALSQHIGHGARVGFPIFELDRFTKPELTSMKCCDGLFVCSKWAEATVRERLRESKHIRQMHIDVVPLGVDRSIFSEAQPSVGGPTVFLNIGKWEVRKGHDIIRDAFDAAFTPKDNVELWMMNYNCFLTPQANGGKDGNAEWNDYYMSSPLANKIKLLPRVDSQEQVAEVMRRADCGVFPARGEGWNLELLEMMSCGRRVIATYYSAHTEFCNTENSLLIEVTETEPAHDGKWFYGQGEWAKLGETQFDELVAHMRRIHQEKQTGGNMFNEAGVQMAADYSWDLSTTKLINAIKSYGY